MELAAKAAQDVMVTMDLARSFTLLGAGIFAAGMFVAQIISGLIRRRTER